MDRWHLDLIVRQSRFSCRMCRWRGLASKGPHRFLVALTPARPRYDAGTGTTPLPALDLRGSPAAGLSEERCVRVRPDPRGDGRG